MVSEAVTPLPLEFEFRSVVYSTGGELDNEETPFLAEDGDGEG